MSARVTCTIIVIAALVLAGCEQKTVTTTVGKRVNVTVEKSKSQELSHYVDAIGTLNPFEEVIVSAEIDGRLHGVNVDEGSVVKQKMVLATINEADYLLAVQNAGAELAKATASLINLKAEHARKKSLYDERLVTEQMFDDVSSRLAIAQAEVQRAESTLLIQKENLGKTRILSPINGTVKLRKVSPGNFVRRGDNLFVIIETGSLKLNFTVPEKYAGALHTGMKVTFSVDAFSNKEFQADVSILYPNVDDKTRTLQVESIAANVDNTLRPGMFAHVRLYTDAPAPRVLIPVIALLYEGDVIKVFTVTEGIAKETRIRTGNKHGEYMEITGGLSAAEDVVVSGQLNLFDGAKVNVAR